MKDEMEAAALNQLIVDSYKFLWQLNNAEPHADIPDPCWLCAILDEHGKLLEKYDYFAAKKHY